MTVVRDSDGSRLRRPHTALAPGVRAAVGRVLRAGVAVSAAILLAGYVVAFVSDPGMFGSHAVEHGHLAARAAFPHSLAAIWDGIGRGRGEAIIVAGVARSAPDSGRRARGSAVAFARRRDWLFAAISATVLSVILGSFVIGWLA